VLTNTNLWFFFFGKPKIEAKSCIFGLHQDTVQKARSLAMCRPRSVVRGTRWGMEWPAVSGCMRGVPWRVGSFQIPGLTFVTVYYSDLP